MNAYAARALRLQKHVEAYAHADFEWGRFDCCAWAADWVAAELRRDPMQDFRGLKSALEAARAIRALGGLQAAISQRMGEPLAAPLLAGMGDAVLMPTPRGVGRSERGMAGDALGYSVGICMGDYVAVPQLRGLGFVPMAWRKAGSDVFQASGVAAWRV